MTNRARHRAVLCLAAVGLIHALPVHAASVSTQPLIIFWVETTPEISAKCEGYIDRVFGRGQGAENHRTAGLAACIGRRGAE